MSKRLLIVLTILPTLTLCILAGVFAFAFLNGTIQINSPNTTEATALETEPPATEASSTESTEPVLTPVQEPSTGYIFEDFEGLGLGESICPFTVETAFAGGYYFVIDPIRMPHSGSSESDELYYELLEKYCEIRFYARSNSVVDILVPLGEYEIYYATGDTWYGEDLLFGPETQYYKCEGTFEFTEDYDGYSGWTLTLESVVGGNLDTSRISEGSFPK